MKQLILASQSPRRIELIQTLGVDHAVQSANIDETFSDKLSPIENVQHVAQRKAKDVFDSLAKKTDHVVLGVDTIVVCDERIMMKPKDRDDAYRMIAMLSGRTHEVHSGVCLMAQESIVTFCETSHVEFIALSEDEIHAYVNTDEPYDKAGAYGIQGTAGMFIRSIRGCYYNIMGLPISRIYRTLRDTFGFSFHWE